MFRITIEVPDVYDLEISFDKESISSIPKEIGGLYLIFNKESDLMYIGKSTDLRGRIRNHTSVNSNMYDFKHNFHKVYFYYLSDPVDLDIVETYLINTLKPKLNYDKVYTYSSERYEVTYLSDEAKARLKEQQDKIDQAMLNFRI